MFLFILFFRFHICKYLKSCYLFTRCTYLSILFILLFNFYTQKQVIHALTQAVWGIGSVFKIQYYIKIMLWWWVLIPYLSSGREKAMEQFCGWNIILLLTSQLVQDWRRFQMKRYSFNLLLLSLRVCRITVLKNGSLLAMLGLYSALCYTLWILYRQN